MKTTRFLILGVFATTMFCLAQDNQPARYGAGRFLAPPPTNAPLQFDLSRPRPQVSANVQTPGGTSAIAEAITPEIASLARDLENDPKRIFDYVHDHIRYVHYFGSHKGAQMTLLERSGNDFDQCALLVALLQAAGMNPSYEFAVVSIPYSTNTLQDYQHWLGTSLPNTNWDATTSLAGALNGERGFPFPYTSYGGVTNLLLIQHLWVQLTVNGTNYSLDPSFKVNLPIAGINLDSAMGLNVTNLLNIAGGTATPDYVQGLNEAGVRSTLQGYTTTLLAAMQTNYPNSSVPQIAGGQQIVSSASQPLGAPSAFTIQTQSGAWPTSQWNYIPTNLMAVLQVSLLSYSTNILTPSLAGGRLCLTFDSSGLAQLWLEDNQIGSVQTAGDGSYLDVTLGIQHPYGTWDLNANNLVRSANWDESYATSYLNANSSYVLLYAFEMAPAWLSERQQALDAYRRQGYADTSRQVQTETLNVMGLSWLYQTEMIEELLGAQTGVIPQWHHRLGRMAEETGAGYYIDVYEQLSGDVAGTGTDPASVQAQNLIFQGGAYFDSALEHGVIEQEQIGSLVAASTVKILELANTNSQAIYLLTPDNWDSISGQLVNYDLGYLYDQFISQGFDLLLPQNGAVQIAGAGSWTGSGYVALQPQSSYQQILMLIGGGYQGGYVSDPNATPNPFAIVVIDWDQPWYFDPESPLLPIPLQIGADPVDMATGTLRISTTDLSLGQAEPRGINFSRYYSPNRRNSNVAGMANGWVHNYYCNVAEVSASQAAFGGTTPQQMAPMLVAARALLNVYNSNQPDPKNWMVTALIAKWGIDQVIKNAVSVNLGEDTIQFIKQPDGSLTPPANCTMTLSKGASGYTLQQRHGNAFNFDSLGRLTNIVDQYNQPLTVSYLSTTSSLPQLVTDWKGRTLTFNYTGGQLTSVADISNRSVIFGYSTAYNPQGDLTSVTDPEGKTRTFTYDSNHQIIATFDALNRLVVTNVYDNFGRVVVQYTQGDTNKAWSILWSGWQTVEQDPAGSKRRFFYDDKTRPIGQQDALGNLTQTFYDGQDHVVATVSALNETNQFAYDGNHNLIYRIDPLGFTNQFVYDNQNNLVQTNDARGNPSRFGYNAQFSLTGFTNGAGQWVAYGYNSDGTLHTRADSAGTTTYGYDSYGQLNSIAYPGGFGTEGFLNSALGDMLSHTNPRLFVTSFQYNQRRELTNTIAPTNLTVSITYDSVGNVQARKDARGFSTTSTWSPTRKLLTTTFPATPQGVPVITSVYDNRDWLTQTLDPLQQPTLYTNDPAHNAISTTDPLLRTILFGYDADGRKTATTNAIREVTLQQWNARGDLAKVTDAATHTVLRQYYGAGNQIILTNRNGKQWQFQFDGANRLTNTISPLNRQTQVSFNDRGLVWTVREPSGQMTTNSYDARGRLTNRVDGVASTVYAYDADNNMTNVVENGKTNSWAFDAYDRVSSYRDADGNVIQYRYDANGNLINLIYPGNRTVSYFYDSLNRLTNVTDWANRKTFLTYDLANRLTSITRPNGSQRIINYDAAGEVTNIVEQTALKYPIAFSALNWTNIGQVGWEFAAPLPHAATLPTRTMTYDDDDRLKTFNGQTVVNDPDGNMTTGPLMTNTLASYTYDARNRLLNAGGISYGYDPAGNRTSMTNGATVTTYVINPNAKLPQVLMRIQGGVTNYYVYGAGLLYQVTETGATATTLTYHYDYRGSTVALTDDTGNITDRIEYSAYATITYRTGTSDTPFLFNGRYGVMTDPNGLLYMRARFYNPYICRFVNADPSGFAGGLNFYAYANGNPVSYIDPFGLRGFIDRLSQFLRGVGATAGGAALILVSEGPWAVATVPTGAVGVTYGIGNMVAAFAMDANDELALRMEGAPSSPAQIGGYLVAGENGQVVVGVIEAGIDVANTANSGKLLDRIKSLVDFLDAANDMNTLLNKY